jgi:hypothetical protein
MPLITYEEFLTLPKGKRTKTLIPGKKYYIKDGVRKNVKYIDVWTGTFDKETAGGETFVFTGVEHLVKPVGFASVAASRFAKSGWIYTEVLSVPRSSSHSSSHSSSRSRSSSSGGKKKRKTKRRTLKN